MQNAKAILEPAYPHLVFLGPDPVILPPHPAGSDKDLPSILLIHGVASDFEDHELVQLEETGRILTAWYDERVGGPRLEANATEVFKREGGNWTIRKLTWREGRISASDIEDGVQSILSAYDIDPVEFPQDVSATP